MVIWVTISAERSWLFHHKSIYKHVCRTLSWPSLSDQSDIVPGGCGAGVVDCESGSGSVKLEEFDATHPFAQLQGSDNIIEFTTQRWSPRGPLPSALARPR